MRDYKFCLQHITFDIFVLFIYLRMLMRLFMHVFVSL